MDGYKPLNHAEFAVDVKCAFRTVDNRHSNGLIEHARRLNSHRQQLSGGIPAHGGRLEYVP